MELSLRDVARLLDVSEDVVARWVRQRELYAVRVGGHYRVNKIALQEWAAARGLRVSPELYAPEGHVEQLPSLHAALERGQIHYHLEGTQRDEILRSVVDCRAFQRESTAIYCLNCCLAGSNWRLPESALASPSRIHVNRWSYRLMSLSWCWPSSCSRWTLKRSTVCQSARCSCYFHPASVCTCRCSHD